MSKSLKKICFYAMLIPLSAYADVKPESLIKVTPKNNPDCVEYYTYKNAMYCSTTAQSQQPINPNIKDYETQTIAFDNRPWQAAWGEKTPTITTVEYVPLGDDINQWHELVTSQFIPDPQNNITPKQFTDAFIKGIKDAGFSPIINLIKDTPDEIILEFRIESPSNQIQDELQRIRKGDGGLYILHYTIKQADMGQTNRDKWLRILQNSTIIPKTHE